MQYESLTRTVEVNNEELNVLRTELSTAQSTYQDLLSQQHSLETELDTLKARNNLTLSLADQRHLSQLKLNI